MGRVVYLPLHPAPNILVLMINVINLPEIVSNARMSPQPQQPQIVLQEHALITLQLH